jgi:hypothetical protein
VSSPQTLKPQHIIAATPCKQNLPFAERRRLNELARQQLHRDMQLRLERTFGKERCQKILGELAETPAAPAPAPVAAPVTAPEPTPADTTDRPATSAELEELLADLDMNALAGTETIEEVIETMTEADLDSIEPPATVAPAPSPIETVEPIPDPATKAELEAVVADLDESDEATAAIYDDEPGVVWINGQKFRKGDPKCMAPFRRYMDRRAAEDEAADRQREADRAAAKVAKRAGDKERKHKSREKANAAKVATASAPAPLPSKDESRELLKALRTAIAASSPTDYFLQSLIDREQELVRFWLVSVQARRTPGKNTDAKVAKLYTSTIGKPVNRHQALRLRHVVEQLLSPGNVWHR